MSNSHYLPLTLKFMRFLRTDPELLKNRRPLPQSEPLQKHILFTGGGSSGHVTPNIALIQKCQQAGWQTSYMGSTDGVEKNLIGQLDIPYHNIASGKLRRYFSWQNFIDPCKIVYGVIQATVLLHQQKPDVVFSKGGFVAFPVVLGAWLNRIPVITHESDLMPGLANRLGAPFAKRICLTFPGSEKYFKDKTKLTVTGTPIRQALFQGDIQHAREFCGFNQDKPILLVTGGGLGAEAINQVIWQALPKLLAKYQVIHLCGQGKKNPEYNQPGYKQVEYVHQEMADLLAAADIVLARAGSNTVYELLALHKPHIFVPLPREVSNGHQILNAQHFADLGLSHVIWQQDLNTTSLLSALAKVETEKATLKQNLSQYPSTPGTDKTYQVIADTL